MVLYIMKAKIFVCFEQQKLQSDVALSFLLGGQWVLWGVGDRELGGDGIGSSGGAGSGNDEDDGGNGVIVPTTETSKHTYFLQLALQHGFPFGRVPLLNELFFHHMRKPIYYHPGNR